MCHRDWEAKLVAAVNRSCFRRDHICYPPTCLNRATEDLLHQEHIEDIVETVSTEDVALRGTTNTTVFNKIIIFGFVITWHLTTDDEQLFFPSLLQFQKCTLGSKTLFLGIAVSAVNHLRKWANKLGGSIYFSIHYHLSLLSSRVPVL